VSGCSTWQDIERVPVGALGGLAAHQHASLKPDFLYGFSPGCPETMKLEAGSRMISTAGWGADQPSAGGQRRGGRPARVVLLATFGGSQQGHEMV
jgi:hypothetical protein